MTLAQQRAPQRYEGRRCESELLGPQKRRHYNVPAGLHLTVGLEPYSIPQAIHEEHLLRFSQTKLPGTAGMFDRRERTCAGPSVMAAD